MSYSDDVPLDFFQSPRKLPLPFVSAPVTVAALWLRGRHLLMETVPYSPISYSTITQQVWRPHAVYYSGTVPRLEAVLSKRYHWYLFDKTASQRGLKCEVVFR